MKKTSKQYTFDQVRFLIGYKYPQIKNMPMPELDISMKLTKFSFQTSIGDWKLIRQAQLFLEGNGIDFDSVKGTVAGLREHINYNLAMKLELANSPKVIFKRPKARRTIAPISDAAIKMVLNQPEGIHEFYGDVPITVGQVSRFVIAWWQNKEGYKYIRFFGDRIHLKKPYPEVPRLVPFGQKPYYVVFETDDPLHCLKCKSAFTKEGEGIWTGTDFVCIDCKYEIDTGFRKPRKNKLKQ